MKKLLSLILVLMISITMIGCSSNSAPKEVTIVEFSWESVNIHNYIMKYILEGAYGYKVNMITAESAPGLTAIENNDAQIGTEVWMDNRGDWWEASGKNSVVQIGDTFEGIAYQGWYIPNYMDPSIVTIDDFKKYCESTDEKDKLISAPSGWGSYEITKMRMEGYGLTDLVEFVDPGSGSALDVEIVSLYEKNLPFCTYYWEPTVIIGKLDMRRLQEAPYNEETWNTTYLCEYPDSSVKKLMNKSYAEDPNNKIVLDLMNKYQIKVSDVNKILADREASGETFEVFIKNWMKDNDSWYYLVDDDPQKISDVINYLNKEDK